MFSGMNQNFNLGRKSHELSPSGQNPSIGSGFSNSSKMNLFGGKPNENDSDNDSFYGSKGFPQPRSERDLSSQMSGLNLSNLPSSTALGSQNQGLGGSGGFFGSNSMLPGAGFNKSKEQNDRSSPSWGWGQSGGTGGGFPQGFGGGLQNLPPSSSRPMTSSSLSQFTRSLSQPSFSNNSSQENLPNFPQSKLLPGQSSPQGGLLSMSQQQSQQQQQQQRGVIGQMPPSIPPGMGSPSGSPGLSNKNPASSRPAGMPASSTSMANQSNNSLPVSSMVFPGFPNINRSMSSNNGLNQQQQQQHGVIGQMAPSIPPGMGSPSGSPGLGSKNPASSRPAASTSMANLSSDPFPGFPNHRSMSSNGGPNQGLLGSVIQSSAMGEGNTMHSSASNPSSGGTSFDQDFPALANRIGPTSRPGGPPSSFSFVMASGSKGLDGNQEFQIHSEDFPALPGSQQINNNRPLPESVMTSQQSHHGQLFQPAENKDSQGSNDHYRLGTSYEQILKDGRMNVEKKSRTPVSGIHTSSSGVITNIPAGMVTDQFGMIGLLTFIRAAETEPNLVTLAVGSDLTTLGLNLNSTESLYHTFGSPFSDSPCKPHEIDFYAPQEYLISPFIRDKLAPIKLGRYGEDLLFYLYYTNCGDILQLAAASELYARDWRYHKDERVWITRFPGVDPQVKTNTYERGTYYYFDSQGWRKVAKEFHVEYDRLEAKPTVQSLQQQQQQQQQQQVAQQLSVA